MTSIQVCISRSLSCLYSAGSLTNFAQDGKPSTDRRWVEVFGKLTGTVLAIWDADSLDTPNGEPTPNYINITDSTFKSIPSLPSPNGDLSNIIVLSTTLKNRYLLQLATPSLLNEWTSALRLSQFEHTSLQEAYTGALLSSKGSKLNGIKTLLSETKFRHEDYVSVRFGSGMPWRKCWTVVTPMEVKKKKNLPPPATIAFYEDKKKMKRPPLALITGSYASYAVYPESSVLVNGSTLLKIEGKVTFNDVEGEKDASVFLMPEAHPGVPGFETLIRFLIPVLDTFHLYGRPSRLNADKADLRSLLFGMPTLPFTQYLEVADLSTLVTSPGTESWTSYEWTRSIKDLLARKISTGYKGTGKLKRLNSTRSAPNLPKNVRNNSNPSSPLVPQHERGPDSPNGHKFESDNKGPGYPVSPTAQGSFPNNTPGSNLGPSGPTNGPYNGAPNGPYNGPMNGAPNAPLNSFPNSGVPGRSNMGLNMNNNPSNSDGFNSPNRSFNGGPGGPGGPNFDRNNANPSYRNMNQRPMPGQGPIPNQGPGFQGQNLGQGPGSNMKLNAPPSGRPGISPQNSGNGPRPVAYTSNNPAAVSTTSISSDGSQGPRNFSRAPYPADQPTSPSFSAPPGAPFASPYGSANPGNGSSPQRRPSANDRPGDLENNFSRMNVSGQSLDPANSSRQGFNDVNSSRNNSTSQASMRAPQGQYPITPTSPNNPGPGRAPYPMDDSRQSPNYNNNNMFNPASNMQSPPEPMLQTNQQKQYQVYSEAPYGPPQTQHGPPTINRPPVSNRPPPQGGQRPPPQGFRPGPPPNGPPPNGPPPNRGYAQRPPHQQNPEFQGGAPPQGYNQRPPPQQQQGPPGPRGPGPYGPRPPPGAPQQHDPYRSMAI